MKFLSKVIVSTCVGFMSTLIGAAIATAELPDCVKRATSQVEAFNCYNPIEVATVPTPQAPNLSDVKYFESHIDLLEARNRTDLFKGVIIKDKTIVLLVDDAFAMVSQQVVYDWLKASAEEFNELIGYRYRTGIAFRTESGVWLGGIDTNTFEYYAP